MSEFEASADIKLQENYSGSNTVSDKAKRYYLTVWTLVITLVILFISNFVLYSSYKNSENRFADSLKKMKVISDDKSGLIKSNEILKSENSKVKSDIDKIKESNKAILLQNEEIVKKMQEIKKTNDELVRKNKELIEDNIELQNTLKKAASVGIKPQSYTNFNGISSRGDLNRGEYLGKFLGTAYTPCKEECGNNDGITNSGKPIIAGISVAVDNKYWPFGTVFYIKGLGYAVAMDTGGAIKGKNRFDFAVFDRKFADSFGANYWDVYLVRLGKGKVENISF